MRSSRQPQTFDESQVETLGRMKQARWCAAHRLAGWTFRQREAFMTLSYSFQPLRHLTIPRLYCRFIGLVADRRI